MVEEAKERVRSALVNCLSRMIADLAGAETIGTIHIAEALTYRFNQENL